MIRKLDEENLTYAFPEVSFSEDYVICLLYTSPSPRD